MFVQRGKIIPKSCKVNSGSSESIQAGVHGKFRSNDLSDSARMPAIPFGQYRREIKDPNIAHYLWVSGLDIEATDHLLTIYLLG
jgi:hypothetical protein